MAGLALGILFTGYATLYYGVTQVQGANYGFLDLVLPSRSSKLAGIKYDDGHVLGGGATPKPPTKTTPSAASSTTAQKVAAGVPRNVVKSPAISVRPTPGR